MGLMNAVFGAQVEVHTTDRSIDDAQIVSAFATGEVVSTHIIAPDIMPYTSADFVVIAMRSQFQAEAEWQELRFAGSTIGYAFPISALVEGTALQGTHWPLVYLRAASDAVLNGTVIDGIARSLKLAPMVTLELEDVLPPDMAIVVLGRQQLSGSAIRESDVTLSLHKLGYRHFRPDEINTPMAGSAHTPRVNVQRMSGELSPVRDLIMRLLTLAMNETSPVGRFIATYQIFELLIGRLFELRMHALLAKACTTTTNGWAVREAINDFLSEKSRFEQLINAHLVSSVPAGLKQQTYSHAVNLIGLLEPGRIIDPKTDLTSLIYDIRNFCVHRQRAISDNMREALFGFVDDLTHIALHVLHNFKEPPWDEPSLVLEQRVRRTAELAYHCWESENRPLGRDLDFWSRAESMLRPQW